MLQYISTVDEVSKDIENGKVLLLAGDEELLSSLPKGEWIGGTIPYFVTPEEGGVVCKDKLFVTDISDVVASCTILAYDDTDMALIYEDAVDDDFTVLIIPAMSSVHSSFALNAPNYKRFGQTPLAGWISGVHLDDIGNVNPKVFNGRIGVSYEHTGVAMHVSVPADKAVNVGIINIFEPGDGDNIVFPHDGFSHQTASVNGSLHRLATYIEGAGIDTKLPLVADYYGANVNVSFQGISDNRDVTLYAPVFSGVRYRVAKPVEDYAKLFEDQLSKNNVNSDKIIFSCNCILNYLYSELHGKKTGDFVGPVTFGEIAYQLLNQTLVYIELLDRKTA